MKRIQRTPGHERKESDHWQTPRDLFAALNAEFDFSIDLAADQSNHRCKVWLGPGGIREDALSCDWAYMIETAAMRRKSRSLWAFLNMPYSTEMIKKFHAKIAEECALTKERYFGLVTLAPDDHSTRWYRANSLASEIRRIPHRVPYLKADGQTKAGAMFPSMVGVFRPQPGVANPSPRVVSWSWRKE